MPRLSTKKIFGDGDFLFMIRRLLYAVGVKPVRGNRRLIISTLLSAEEKWDYNEKNVYTCDMTT